MAGNRRVNDRVESQQRGRSVVERVEQQLRSAQCVQNPTTGALLSPIVSASDNQVTFYTWLPQSSTDISTPLMRQITFDPTAKTLTQKTWSGWTTPPDPATAPPDSPNGTVTLLDNVTATPAGNPFFAYYASDATTPLSTAGMTTAQRDSIVRVALGMAVGPKVAAGSSPDTYVTFADDVTVRLPPNYSQGTATGGPLCVP